MICIIYVLVYYEYSDYTGILDKFATFSGMDKYFDEINISK